jgi:hypothetical protein
MKNKISKKIIGTLIVLSIIATIGAVIVSADSDEDNEEKNLPIGFFGRHPKCRKNPFLSELTDKQREEIKEIRETMEEEGKTPDEIREAIKQQLESYGIEIPTIKERIDIEIEKTEKKLEILEYIKELLSENPDLTREEIRENVESKFDIELPDFNEEGMNFRHKFRGRGCNNIGEDFSFNYQTKKM